MKDLLHYLLTNLVDDLESVEISEAENNGMVTLTVKVAKEDMGKVIGKEGKIIRAVRDCVKIRALKENKYVDVILAE